jgi:ribosome-binding protein aMBF1 (putative translation factor)
MDKRPDFKTFKEEALKNPEVREEYEALRAEFEVMIEFIKARKSAKLSQEELAKKLKVQQPSIARLENGGYATTSIHKLSKVANVLGYSLKISLQAQAKKRK